MNATPTTSPTPPRTPKTGRGGVVLILILAAALFGFVTAPHLGTAAYRSTVNHTSPTQP